MQHFSREKAHHSFSDGRGKKGTLLVCLSNTALGVEILKRKPHRNYYPVFPERTIDDTIDNVQLL